MANTTVKNAWINNISKSLVRMKDGTDKKGNPNQFASVSIPVSTEISQSGWMSITLRSGQVRPATKGGQVSDTYVSLLLGAPEKERNVSVCTKLTKAGKPSKAKDAYETIQMTNEAIAAAFDAHRAEYKAAQAVETEGTVEG